MSTMPTTFDKETLRFEANPQDLYVTDMRLVDACLERIHRLMPVVETFVDPGCGTGNWGRGVKARWPLADGYGIDIVNRLPVELPDNPYNWFSIGDFIDNHCIVRGMYDLVIGNPPFSSKKDKALARKFIETGLECLNEFGLLGYVLKTEALCSLDRYEHIFKNNPPIEQWVCVQRPGWYGDGTTNTIEYSFFIWKKANPAGYTKTRWLSWR